VILFVVCSAVLVIVSLFTPAPPTEKVAGLTFARAPAGAITREAANRGRDILLSLLLMAFVAVVWIYFS
jgi:SSS family solute:Na+ symporter